MKGLLFCIIILLIFLIMSAIAEFLASIVTMEMIMNTLGIFLIFAIVYIIKN